MAEKEKRGMTPEKAEVKGFILKSREEVEHFMATLSKCGEKL